MHRIFLIVAALALMPPAAFAQDYRLGSLEIIRPHARPTPPNAPVGGGYAIIRNTGSDDDRLVAASARFAGKVEIHQMKMEGAVMRMRAVEDGLAIPAGGEVRLEPGGMHFMFMQLREQMQRGRSYTVVLKFEKAGEIEVPFSVD